MKRNFSRTFILLLIIFTMILSSAACTKREGEQDSENTITVIMDNKDRAYLEGLIQEFKAKFTQYDVNPIWTAGDDIHSSQAQKIGTRNAPDVIIGGDMYTELYRRSLMDLAPLIERDADEVDIDDIVEGIMENLKDKDGRTLFMPRFFNISLLYFNKGLFDASKNQLLSSGITAAPAGTPEGETHYPHINWTVEDFFKAGGILTKNSGSSFTQWGATSVYGWWGEWLIYLRQSGGDIFDQNGYVTFNNQNARNAMQIVHDKAYGNAQLSRPKISVAPGEADLAGFQGKKTAMEYGGHTANWSRYDSISGLNWGVTVLPTGLNRRKGAEFATEGYGIFKDTINPVGSWEFIKFMTNQQGIAKGSEAGYLTVRKSVFDNMEAGVKKQRTQLALDAINPDGPYGEYAMTLPKYEYFSEIATGIIESEISLMVAHSGDTTKISIDAAIANIERKCNDYIDLNYR